MERGLKAAALFALIVVASADRALLAGKPAGGALHAVAVTNALIGTAASPNYFITNGNGTWTYAYYSNNGVSNGNNAGQGGVSYPAVNTAFAAAADAAGTIALANTKVFTTAPTPTTDAAIDFYGTKINAIVFPSRNLGVAVGALTDITTINTVEVTIPNIILTIDGGLSWMAATGLPTAAPAVGSITTADATPYPAVSAGDLTSVFFPSKSVGWAVGGNAINTVGITASPQTADALPAGLVYMTTNGGTVWKNIPLFYSVEEAAVAIATGSSSAINAVYSQFVPGVLFGIHSDAAGKNVYAVGSPGMTGEATLNVADWEVDYTQKTTPTIMFSSNGGSSWASQTAPAMSTQEYGLYDVAVLKGTTAFAVGGGMTSTILGGSGTANDAETNGQIIYTNNGGFSWTQAVFPGNSGVKAPVFTSVALNGPTVWVGGYTKTTEYYPVAQVEGANGVTAVNGQSYSVLVSADGKTFVGAATVASFPPGFIITSGLATTATAITTSKDVYGITWDNNVHGFIYGLGYILATHDGGKTWTYESPADIISPDVVAIKALANVPTSY